MGSEERSKEKVSGVSRGMKEEKVAGLCPRDLNRRTIKEVAHSFFFLSLMAVVFRQTVMLTRKT